MGNKWGGFAVKGCRIRNLGRPAKVYIPSHKMRMPMDGRTVEEVLHDYLVREFGAFTTTLLPLFGYWRNARQQVVYDECRQYEVAFDGKHRIPPLIEFLGRLCRVIGEDCLYFTAGQYACTIEPEDE